MRTKTAIHCFGLVSALALVALASEAIIASLVQAEVPSIHQVVPVTSLPFFLKHLTQERGEKNAGISGQSKEKQAAAPIEMATLYLKNGGEVSGEIVSEEEGWITLRIEGSIVGFHDSEINRIQRKKPGES